MKSFTDTFQQMSKIVYIDSKAWRNDTSQANARCPIFTIGIGRIVIDHADMLRKFWTMRENITNITSFYINECLLHT